MSASEDDEISFYAFRVLDTFVNNYSHLSLGERVLDSHCYQPLQNLSTGENSTCWVPPASLFIDALVKYGAEPHLLKPATSSPRASSKPSERAASTVEQPAVEFPEANFINLMHMLALCLEQKPDAYSESDRAILFTALLRVSMDRFTRHLGPLCTETAIKALLQSSSADILPTLCAELGAISDSIRCDIIPHALAPCWPHIPHYYQWIPRRRSRIFLLERLPCHPEDTHSITLKKRCAFHLLASKFASPLAAEQEHAAANEGLPTLCFGQDRPIADVLALLKHDDFRTRNPDVNLDWFCDVVRLSEIASMSMDSSNTADFMKLLEEWKRMKTRIGGFDRQSIQLRSLLNMLDFRHQTMIRADPNVLQQGTLAGV